jgi:hypothetical protein
MGEIGKITELVSTSHVSIEDAINKAVSKLAKHEKDLRGLNVKKVSVKIENGKVVEWRVNLKAASEF